MRPDFLRTGALRFLLKDAVQALVVADGLDQLLFERLYAPWLEIQGQPYRPTPRAEPRYAIIITLAPFVAAAAITGRGLLIGDIAVAIAGIYVLIVGAAAAQLAVRALAWVRSRL